MALHLGCAVWAFPKWVGDFYPEGTRQPEMLSLYAERLRCVEGNAVFYAVPSEATMARWVEATPESFRFCPKLPRDISHGGALAPRIPEAVGFAAHMQRGLGERLGPVFLQLPPSYGPQEGPDLAKLLNAWRREVGHPLLVELRHPGWFEAPWVERLDTLLRRLGLGRVQLDTRPIYSGSDNPQAQSQRKKPRLPLRAERVGELALVRYISHPEPARNEAFLAEWAARVAAWLRDGVEVYFFVHCPEEEHSPGVARRFDALLRAEHPALPPLPWASLPPPPQRALF